MAFLDYKVTAARRREIFLPDANPSTSRLDYLDSGERPGVPSI